MLKPTLLTLSTAALLVGASFSAFADMAKPDSDMQAVLDAQATLMPKPIETLTPVEARKQPTPADGAKLVMKNNDMDPNDPMSVVTKNITYKSVAGAQIDPLRSDGERLAEKLTKAGVAVKSETYQGATHEFFGMGAVVGDAKDAEGFVAGELKTVFDRTSSL